MKHKNIALLILNLMIISLFSIGFASWVIVDPATTGTGEGSFSSDNIIENNNWITFQTKESIQFSFKGFTSDDNGLNNKIITTINVSIKDIREYYGKTVDGIKVLPSVKIDVKLTYNSKINTEMDFFNYGSVSLKNNSAGVNISGSGGAINKSITLPVTITGLSSDTNNVSFDVIYEFNNVPQEFFSSIDSPIRGANCFYIGTTILVMD